MNVREESVIEQGDTAEARPDPAMNQESGVGGENSSQTRKRRFSGVHSWIRDLIVSVAVSAFIIVFLYQPVRVEGTSMLPMLEDQDRLFINKIAYRMVDIRQGDVVVLQYPLDR